MNDINVYDGMISVNELDEINNLIDRKGFTFGWKSHINKEYRHWHCNFADKEKTQKTDEVKKEDIPDIMIGRAHV